MRRITSRQALSYGIFGYNQFREWQQSKAAERALVEHERRKTELITANPEMAGFAEQDELTQYAYTQESFFLGNIYEDHGVHFAAGVPGDRHVFLVAGSGAGKGRSILIQNAIRWPGPLLAIDPKGEAASVTAIRRGTPDMAAGTGTTVRRFIGQKVAILDPFGETKGPARMRYKVAYDPLSDIDMAGDYSRHIRAVADAAITPGEGDTGAHFSESIRNLLAGLIETVKLCETDPKNHTIPYCADLLLKPRDDIKAYLNQCPVTPASLAVKAAGVVHEIGPNEWGSFRTTLARNIGWMTEPQTRAHMRASDFSLWRAVQEGWSIYIVLPPDQMGDFKGWLRVLVRTAINAKIALGTDQRGLQTLFQLDEFPLLGRFKIIEEAAGYLRGYGVKLAPVIQNIGQVKDHYPKNWETFLGNAGAIIAFGTNDEATERYLSNRLGKVTVHEMSFGTSGGINQQVGLFRTGSGGTNQSENIARRERTVRHANEIHHQFSSPTARGLVIPDAGKPFMIRRQNYDAIPEPGLFDAPEHIRAWEDQHGKDVIS